MYKHLLVPLDGSPLSAEIISQAVAFAAVLGARITFFTAQADFAASHFGALLRSVAPEAYADNVAGDARGLLRKAELAARTAGVDCATKAVTSDRPYAAIIKAAEEAGCDLIFMGSRGVKGVRGLMVGSQTQKVLANTPLPVLVATVQSNQREREKHAAIAIIQDEHRSLAAVVRGLQHLMDEAEDGKTPLDTALLRAIVRYIDAFPERVHHPKEEAYLFARLKARTSAFDEALNTLRAEHAESGPQVRALAAAVERYGEAANTETLAAVAAAARVFAEALWAHMNLEENVILPAAREHLRQEDWAVIHAAFAENGDPRFDADLDEGFRNLYSRIMNLAA
ncbi:MAG: universal stress protein [Azonexus sp.]|jgi:hemerythrin-like domain-containing protein/nucleotide-binding universal stress UspA family protein|nr:universal stress protein [Azonexus sp.]